MLVRNCKYERRETIDCLSTCLSAWWRYINSEANTSWIIQDVLNHCIVAEPSASFWSNARRILWVLWSSFAFVSFVLNKVCIDRVTHLLRRQRTARKNPSQMLYFARKGIRDLNDQLEVYRQFPTAVGDYEEAPQQKNREDLLFVWRWRVWGLDSRGMWLVWLVLCL